VAQGGRGYRRRSILGPLKFLRRGTFLATDSPVCVTNGGDYAGQARTLIAAPTAIHGSSGASRSAVMLSSFTNPTPLLGVDCPTLVGRVLAQWVGVDRAPCWKETEEQPLAVARRLANDLQVYVKIICSGAGNTVGYRYVREGRCLCAASLSSILPLKPLSFWAACFLVSCHCSRNSRLQQERRRRTDAASYNNSTEPSCRRDAQHPNAAKRVQFQPDDQGRKVPNGGSSVMPLKSACSRHEARSRPPHGSVGRRVAWSMGLHRIEHRPAPHERTEALRPLLPLLHWSRCRFWGV
jgi:hypothetical protein